MKKCSACKTEKPLEAFNKNASKRDGLQTKCIPCQKSWYKEYYNNSDKEKVRLTNNNLRYREDVRSLIRTTKDVPCTDCNVKYPYYVMDFDHLDSTEKEFCVGLSVWNYKSTKKIKEEIAKCDVVCSNCHRVRTHNRRTIQ